MRCIELVAYVEKDLLGTKSANFHRNRVSTSSSVRMDLVIGTERQHYTGVRVRVQARV